MVIIGYCSMIRLTGLDLCVILVRTNGFVDLLKSIRILSLLNMCLSPLEYDGLLNSGNL